MRANAFQAFPPLVAAQLTLALRHFRKKAFGYVLARLALTHGKSLSIGLALALLGSGVHAQDRYEVFVGHYVASVHIAVACDGITTTNQQGAATVANEQDGLRRQRVLRLVYYGNSDQLRQMGNAALSARGVSTDDTGALCQFGRAIAGQNDQIGRFLRAQ